MPGLTPTDIAYHGLGDIKKIVPVQRWDEAVIGIDHSLVRTWYLTAALACTTQPSMISISISYSA